MPHLRTLSLFFSPIGTYPLSRSYGKVAFHCSVLGSAALSLLRFPFPPFFIGSPFPRSPQFPFSFPSPNIAWIELSLQQSQSPRPPSVFFPFFRPTTWLQVTPSHRQRTTFLKFFPPPPCFFFPFSGVLIPLSSWEYPVWFHRTLFAGPRETLRFSRNIFPFLSFPFT